MTIAICDDSAADRTRLRGLLQEELSQRGEQSARVVEYAGGEGLLADLEEQYETFDLIFLDIYMGGPDGMEIAHRLRERGCRTPLVFLTATPEFAVESYEVRATGYLLKPPDPAKLSALLDLVRMGDGRERVAFRFGREYRYFYQDEILCAESRNSTILLWLLNGNCVSFKGKLGEVERELCTSRFLRCHQSFIVNMDHVADVDGDFRLKNGMTVPIRVRSRREITEQYYRYFVAHTVARLPKEG